MNRPHHHRVVNLKRPARLAAAGLALLTFALTFATNHDGAFLFDDLASFHENHAVTGFDPLSMTSWIRGAFDAPARLRPLANLSFAWQWFLFGPDAAAFHAANDLLHALAAAALLLLLLEFSARHAEAWSERRRLWIAIGGAALWALHPVQTQPVTYIVQRMSVLAGLFSILAFLFYLRARKDDDRKNYLLASAAYLLALASKENAAVVPVIVGLYEILLGDAEEPAARRRRFLLIALACVPPLLIAGAYAALSTEHFALGALPNRDFTLWERLLSAPRMYWRYLGLLALPYPLALDYQLPVSRGPLTPWTTLPASAALIALLAAVFIYRKRAPVAAFGALAFFLALAPETTFLNLELFYEHRLYLPSVFVLPLVPAAIAHAQQARALPPRPLVAATAAIVLACAAWSGLRNRDWQSALRLYERNAAVYPENARLQSNLALEYLNIGKPQDALEHARLATKLDDADADTHVNLGLVFQRQGRVDEAITHYEKALRIDPEDLNAHNNLGRALEAEGRRGEAVAHYARALEVDPDFVLARSNLGLAYAVQGSYDEAIAEYERAAAIDPDWSALRVNLGFAYQQKGDLGRAIAEYERAISLDAESAQGHLGLGLALAQQGRRHEAVSHLRESCHLGERRACAAVQQFLDQMSHAPSSEE